VKARQFRIFILKGKLLLIEIPVFRTDAGINDCVDLMPV